MRQMQCRPVRRSAQVHAPRAGATELRDAGPRSGVMSMSEPGTGHEAG